MAVAWLFGLRRRKDRAEMKSPMSMAFTRRMFLASAPLALAGCVAGDGSLSSSQDNSPAFLGLYPELTEGDITIPALDVSEIEPRFLRQVVDYNGAHKPGSIVVDTPRRHLYFVLAGKKAVRYGCGVGKAGFEFKGAGVIGRTAVWPHWAPTPNMIAVQPQRYGPVKAGMPGGIDNPLGARALYIHRDGHESNYRVHGTDEPSTIGEAVSSGCIRLFNHDIIDLHSRVARGAPIMVLQGRAEVV